MPEQNSQNAKAFDPASFSMPAQPSLTYSVIANATEPELSSYVQTVFIRPSGSITPGARLSDQGPAGGRDAQLNVPAQQPPAPPMSNGVSKYQRSSVQFSLSDQTLESTDASSYRPNQNQSFAQPAGRSNLSYLRRTDVSPRQQTDSPATVLDTPRRNVRETENQNPPAKESQTPISKTKLVDLRQGSDRTETPRRDQNTIAKNPDEFLKREAFSNKFKVTPSGEREIENAGSSGKIIYLKSAPPAQHTAKLKVPKLIQQKEPEPVAKPTVARAEPAKPAKAVVDFEKPAETEPPLPQIIQWPIVDSAQEQVLFPAPAVTGAPSPMEIDFVSAAPAIDAETTKIDFAEVNMEAPAESASAPSTQATFDPFQTTEAPEAPTPFDPFQTTEAPEAPTPVDPFQTAEAPEAPTPVDPFQTAEAPETLDQSSAETSSPFQSPQEQTSPVKSSPFQSDPEDPSPFQSPQEESSPFQTAPAEPSPFESTPNESSPFRSTLFQSPSSQLQSEYVAQLSDGETNISESQPNSFAESVDDFFVPSPPDSAVFLAANKEDDVSELTSQSEENTVSEAPPQRSDFTNSASNPSLNSQSGPFQVIGHRRTDFAKDSESITSKLESADSSEVAAGQRTKIILPEFKPSSSYENEHQHFTATTLESGHRAETRSEQQFETPWLSPWWMLIGLIPIALYIGTMKLFKDEDEYHSHKNELFGSHLDFDRDFEDIGSSKSDAIYGREDEVPIARGPSGEAVRLDIDPLQSPIAFAESREFELPSSTEVAQPAFGPELRIDQSPNFSESGRPKTGSQKRKQPKAEKKRSEH